MDWQVFDRNMLLRKYPNLSSVVWYDPAEAPFAVEGLYWFYRDGRYGRFPVSSDEELSLRAPGAAALSRHTSGGQVLFRTDSDVVYVSAELDSPSGMDHFAATGESGMDLYVSYGGGQYHYAGVTRFDRTKDHYLCQVLKENNTEMKDIILDLPLYAHVRSLKIGLRKKAVCLPNEKTKHTRPIVFYGTSITQGGCASRPGLLYTNILSRDMDRSFLNFGFSGSGRGEPCVARLLASIADPAGYVLCYEANAGMGIKSTLSGFVDMLRKAHPSVPVLVISNITFHYERYMPMDAARREDMRLFQENFVAEMRGSGDENIHYLDGRALLPDHPDECFVDGVHPNDLGFWQIAVNLRPVLELYF